MAEWQTKTRGAEGQYANVADKRFLVVAEKANNNGWAGAIYCRMTMNHGYATIDVAKERILRHFKLRLEQALADVNELLKEFGG